MQRCSPSLYDTAAICSIRVHGRISSDDAKYKHKWVCKCIEKSVSNRPDRAD